MLYIVLGHASGTPIAFEPETGTIASPATRVTDGTASGGAAVKFGTAPTGGTGDSATPFTFATLPDVQRDLWNMTNITQNFNGRFNYLVANKTALNLKFMFDDGDFQDTDNLLCAVGTPAAQQSTCSHDLSINPRYMANPPFNIDHFQYHWASEGLKIIENANIPYLLTLGNHDTGAVCGGPACTTVAGQTQQVWQEVRNTSTWNSYYTPAREAVNGNTQGLNASDTSGVYELGKSDNMYKTFDAGGLHWLAMNLELWPRSDVYTWANAVAASHPHYNVIVTTHSYLTGGGTIEQTNGGYGATSPQYMFDNFVKLQPNIRFVFSGHVGNSDYRVDTGVNGNKIYDLMDCYHDTVNNWIRLLTVNVDQNEITTKVYAPLTNQTRTESQANVDITGINWVH